MRSPHAFDEPWSATCSRMIEADSGAIGEIARPAMETTVNCMSAGNRGVTLNCTT
jgi:hypothetical protein